MPGQLFFPSGFRVFQLSRAKFQGNKSTEGYWYIAVALYFCTTAKIISLCGLVSWNIDNLYILIISYNLFHFEIHAVSLNNVCGVTNISKHTVCILCTFKEETYNTLGTNLMPIHIVKENFFLDIATLHYNTARIYSVIDYNLKITTFQQVSPGAELFIFNSYVLFGFHKLWVLK